MSRPLRVLIIEDSPDDADLLLRELRRAGYAPNHERVDTAAALGVALDQPSWDVVISDNTLPQFSGTRALEQVRARDPDVPFIFVSGTIGEEAATDAMRAGAQDYVMKGNIRRLVPAIERELRDAHVRRERRKAEDALRRSEATYRSLVEDAPYGIFRSTRDGTILAANPSLVRMLGYASEAELLQKNMTADIYVDPGVRDDLLTKIGTGTGQMTAEVMWRRKDKKHITVRQTSRESHDPDSGTIWFDTIVEDITEQRLLETQLRHAQKMDAIGRLAGGIAHDFNNVLTAIIGSADLMLETLADDASEREEAHAIHDAAIRAADLTRQLLAFSRQQVLAPKIIDLNDVVAGVHRLLERLIGEDVQLRTILSPDLGTICADGGQLEQVVVNLAVNARDAMPQGGKLTIETANAELDETYAREHGMPGASGPCVMLAVTDTGTGMSPETQARIFEPFFTTKPAGKGTGLGLATVYGIVKQSEGLIWVYSELGKGTSFKVYFPRVQGKAESLRTVVRDGSSLLGSETVLLVEDQPEVRNLTRRILEMRGYAVLVAASGPEALVLSDQHRGPIDLLITDVVMPGMGGRDVSLTLSPKRPLMKILYLSGYTDQAVIHHGVLEPGVEFLQKPYSADVLARKVREILDAPARAQG